MIIIFSNVFKSTQIYFKKNYKIEENCCIVTKKLTNYLGFSNDRGIV